MKRLFFIILSLVISTNVNADSFTALGNTYKYDLPNSLCSLHDNDPVEKFLLEKAKATSPQLNVPVFIMDCDSLNTVKSGVPVATFRVYGAIKNLKQKYPYSKELFVKDMEKKYGHNDDELNAQAKRNMKAGADNAGLKGELSEQTTKYFGKDEDSIYIGGAVVFSGVPINYISAFSLKNDVVFNIELYTDTSLMSVDEIYSLIKDIKNNL